MKGDKVTREYYGRRFDGADLYRFAVPNVRTTPKPFGEAIGEDEEQYWQAPQYEITQDQTGENYSSAIDVDGTELTYTETDIPVEPDLEPAPEPTSDLTV